MTKSRTWKIVFTGDPKNAFTWMLETYIVYKCGTTGQEALRQVLEEYYLEKVISNEPL